MTFGSLFAGIGGLDLGLERAGMECRWQVEIDEFCRKVLAKHWPNVKRYGDIKTLTGADLKPVDLICGGFPCQPVSVAGRRKRQDDERWLWPEFARIVRVLRPRWVLIENVPGLLAGDWDELADPADDPLWKSGMSDVLGELARSGYDAEWDCIPAAALGAPHLRFRTFIVAYPQSGGTGIIPARSRDEGERMAHTSGSRPRIDTPDLARLGRESGRAAPEEARNGRLAPRREPRRIFTDAPCSRLGDRQRQEIPERWDEERLREPKRHCCTRKPEDQIRGFGWWAIEPGLVRMVHGIPHRVDRIRALGNSVIPQVAEEIGRRIVEVEENRRTR